MDVPEVVVNKARAAGALDWLASLPALVVDLEASWAIRVGRAYPDATEAFVAEAVRTDGTPVVLKLVMPSRHESARREVTALRLAGGEGLVELLAADEDRGALLLERLGPSLKELALPIEARHRVLCDTARQVWRPAAGCGLPTGAEKGRWLTEFIVGEWERLDHPCSEESVQHALACAERRIAAHDDERSVLVHGDVHQWNTLKAAEGYKLVDPDGLLAEPAYDLGIVMREDPEEILAGVDPMARAHKLAAMSGLDVTAIWEWGVVERVSTGLLGTGVGLQPVAGQMLAVADLVAGSSPTRAADPDGARDPSGRPRPSRADRVGRPRSARTPGAPPAHP